VDSNLRNLTTDAKELVAEIHDRMPLIIALSDYPLLDISAHGVPQLR
jgi:hypothetical protein